MKYALILLFSIMLLIAIWAGCGGFPCCSEVERDNGGVIPLGVVCDDAC